MNNAISNLEKSSEQTEIITCHTNEMLTIVPKIYIGWYTDSNSIYLSISISSNDESSQKWELKICELNKSVNYELALLNKNGFFFWIFE